MSQGYCMGNIRKGKDREFVIPFDIQEEFKKDKLEFQRKKKTKQQEENLWVDMKK